MYYHRTLKHPTSVSLCIPGCFTTSERHREFVLLRGPRLLELWTLVPEKGLMLISQQELFGEIVSLKPLFCPREDRDYLVGGSNKGKIFILLFDLRRGAFIEVFSEHCEEPPSKLTGHFVATDPRGRVFIAGAKENIKKVWSVQLNSGLSNGRIEVSSMTFEKNEHLARGVTYDIVGLDITNQASDRNTVSFASTEVYYKECIKRNIESNVFKNTKQQSINFFDVNLTTKTVKFRRKEFLEYRSNFLMEVPGGTAGPGGVLIFCQNQLVYKCENKNLTCAIPYPISEPKTLDKPVIFINCTMYQNRTSFYYLAQNEFGDIFKITLAIEDTIELQMQYFDSLPLAIGLCILEPCYLFAAYESGDHATHQILDSSLCTEPVFSSCLRPANEIFFYFPVPKQRLKLKDELFALNPIMAMEVVEQCAKPERMLYAACGVGKKSRLLAIDQGLEIIDGIGIKVDDLCFKRPVVAVAALNKLWSSVYAVQRGDQDFILLSYAEKTDIYRLLDESQLHFCAFKMLEISSLSSTLACKTLPSGRIIQITSQSVQNAKYRWKYPRNQRAVACALNDCQALVMLENTRLYYLNFGMNGELIIHPTIPKTEAKVQCAVFSDDEKPAHFAVLGLVNYSVCVISLNKHNLLEVVHKMEIHPSSPVTSLLFCHIGPQNSDYLKLFIGLNDGQLLTTHMEKDSGRLFDKQQYQMGSEPVKLFNLGEMIMISTNYPWLYLKDDAGKTILRRMSYGKVETACNFRMPKKFFVFSNAVLRLVTLGDVSKEVVHYLISKLHHTPRSMSTNSEVFRIVMAEADHNANDTKMEKEILKVLYDYKVISPPDIPETSAESGMWSSKICIILHDNKYEAHINTEDVAISIAVSPYYPYIFVAYKNVNSDDHSGLLTAYEFSKEKCEQSLLPIDELDCVKFKEKPSVILGTSIGVLVGVGKDLKMFSISKEKKLYLEAECQCPSFRIDCISSNSENIVVGHSAGLVFLKYYMRIFKGFSKIKILGELESLFVTTCCFINPMTIARADKFGNITILKVHLFNGIHSNKDDLWRKPDDKVEVLCHFDVGEIVLSLHSTHFFCGGRDVLVYSTPSGTIGIIGQLEEPEESILSCLENFMVLKDPVLSQDPKTLRAAHMNRKKIINGDFCEQFKTLDPDNQKEYCDLLLCSSTEQVFFRLEEIRSKFLY